LPNRILVTAGNGMFGHALILQLLDRDDIEVRAMVHNRSKFTLTGSNLSVVEADMDDPASLEPVTRDITHAFVTSPMDEKVAARESAVVDACKANGTPHILNIHGAVRHQGDQLHSSHLAAIEHLKSSGLPWTLVSPNSVMETSLIPYKADVAMGEILGISGEGRIGMVALDDVAAVIAAVATSEGHDGENYELTGPAAVTFGEVAEAFARVLRHPVTYVDMSEEDFAQMLIEHAGFSTSEEVEIQVMCHLRSWREGGASLVTDTVKQLTGRDPMSVEQWIQENQAVFLG
jgi:uncharacterized protein YbjT (DUF2867 family)